MGCLNCGEKYYNYVGIDEEGEDLIECLGCQRIQHFAATPEDGIVEVDYNEDDSPAGYDDGIAPKMASDFDDPDEIHRWMYGPFMTVDDPGDSPW